MWGVIGSTFFTLLVVIFFLTGVIYAAVEKPAPKTKKKGRIGSLIILVGILSIQILSTNISLTRYQLTNDLIGIYLLNYALYLILFVYDTFIIDILILVKWHPDFLHLPNEEVFTSSSYHLKTLILGSILGLLITTISVVISILLFN